MSSVFLPFLQSLRIIARREDFYFPPPPMNLARQRTCNLLLQVKQKFVISLETFKPQTHSLPDPPCGVEKRGCLVAVTPRCVLSRLKVFVSFARGFVVNFFEDPTRTTRTKPAFQFPHRTSHGVANAAFVRHTARPNEQTVLHHHRH